MSLQDYTKAWDLDCDPHFKLSLLWMADDSGGDGQNSWWRYNPQRLCDRTNIPSRFMSKLLGILMQESVLIYDEHMSTERGEPHYLLNIDAWLDDPDTPQEDEASLERRSYQKKKIQGNLRREVFERDAYRCKHCDGWQDLCADHIIPESKGGPTTLENLQTLCRSCNSRKGAK